MGRPVSEQRRAKIGRAMGLGMEVVEAGVECVQGGDLTCRAARLCICSRTRRRVSWRGDEVRFLVASMTQCDEHKIMGSPPSPATEKWTALAGLPQTPHNGTGAPSTIRKRLS